MTDSKGKVLIVDDDERIREATSFLVRDNWGYETVSPDSPGELKDAMAFEFFDSALVDFELQRWKEDLDDYELDDRSVEDGSDIVNFYRNIHDISTVRLYTTKRADLNKRQRQKIEDVPLIQVPILKLGFGAPDMESLKQHFRPFLEETDYVSALNTASFSEFSKEEEIAGLLRDYRKIWQLNRKWISFNFRVVGDYTWAMVCDRRIERAYYGRAMNGNHDKAAHYSIKPNERYPSEIELADIGRAKGSTPFILWNTRNVTILEKQFDLAGPYLENIPEHLQDFFCLAVAKPCAETYLEGNAKSLMWTRRLTLAGQLEALKQVHKRIDKKFRDGFLAQCKSLHLPIIDEIYRATVDEIDEHLGKAWVGLTKWGRSFPTASKRFDLRKLQANGISCENQDFEYTVYKTYTNDEAFNIDLIEDTRRNPFDDILEKKR